MSRFCEFLSAEKRAELKATAEAIVVPGKGILAADESTGNIKCDIFQFESVYQ